MHLPEQTAEMTQRGPVLGRQLMEIEIPERILADLVTDFPDLIRVFLDTRSAPQRPADFQQDPVDAYRDFIMIKFPVHAEIIGCIDKEIRDLLRIGGPQESFRTHLIQPAHHPVRLFAGKIAPQMFTRLFLSLRSGIPESFALAHPEQYRGGQQGGFVPTIQKNLSASNKFYGMRYRLGRLAVIGLRRRPEKTMCNHSKRCIIKIIQGNLPLFR